MTTKVVYYNEGEYDRTESPSYFTASAMPDGAYMVLFYKEPQVYVAKYGAWIPMNEPDVPPWVKIWMLMEVG